MLSNTKKEPEDKNNSVLSPIGTIPRIGSIEFLVHFNGPAELLHRSRTTPTSSPASSPMPSPKFNSLQMSSRSLSFQNFYSTGSSASTSLRSSSFGSLLNLQGLDSSLQPLPGSSPSSGRSSRSNSTLYSVAKPLFEHEEAKPINIRVLNYHPENPNALCSFNSGPDDTYITRLTKDFFDRMLCLYAEHGLLSSFRLQSNPFQGSNRRSSFADLDGFVLSSPKDPRTQTTGNPFDTLCYGHIPKQIIFQACSYSLKDNYFSGAFVEGATHVAPELHSKIRIYEDTGAYIDEVKVINNLITYSEYVELPPVDGQENTRNIKHFIQEQEKLASICDRMERGIYEFISGNTDAVLFYDQNNNLCKLDLKNVKPDDYTDYGNRKAKDFVNLDDFINYLELHEELGNRHAPIWYHKKDNVFLPVMVQAGENGWHIAGDADPEHIGVRSDMPSIAQKTFDCKKDKLNNFILGLQLLILRLKCSSKPDFDHEIEVFKHAIQSSGQSLDDFATVFMATDSKHYKDYTIDDYYSQQFLPAAEATLRMYQAKPALLNIVGVSSSYNLVMHKVFDHPLFIHGPEDSHPGSKPSIFGAILICYKDRFVITSNEQSYFAFLMHDHDILKSQRIGVHPYWLGEKETGADFAEQWLDLLAIQALHEGAKDLHDFETYWQLLIESMGKKRESAKLAIDKINQKFEKIQSFLQQCSPDSYFRSAQIENRIESLYDRYKVDTNEIARQICSNSVPIIAGMPSLFI
jgi:hypothetical protein